jgi:hypothetical protein
MSKLQAIVNDVQEDFYQMIIENNSTYLDEKKFDEDMKTFVENELYQVLTYQHEIDEDTQEEVVAEYGLKNAFKLYCSIRSIENTQSFSWINWPVLEHLVEQNLKFSYAEYTKKYHEYHYESKQENNNE